MILGGEQDLYLGELEHKQEYSYPEHSLAHTECIDQILDRELAKEVHDASQESYEEVQAQGDGSCEVELPVNALDHQEVHSGEGNENDRILVNSYL